MASPAVVTAAPGAPITVARPVRADVPGVAHPGAAHADAAPSADTPRPRPAWPGHSVLAAHAAFFDANGDGCITPAETWRGFYKIGFNSFLSFVAALVIHASFSWPTTQPWWHVLDPRVSLAWIHRGVHGSDSRSFDTEGRFVPQRFDDAFSKYASAKTGAGAPAMTWADVSAMVAGNACARDVFGRAANFLEWSGLFFVAAQRATPDGDSGPHVLTRERARQAMDGSLWPALEHEAAARRAAVATRRGAAWWAPWARGWGGRAGAAHAE